jgi:hypothetical protein
MCVAGAAEPCVVSLRMTTLDFPSVGRFHVPAIRLERAVRDLYGFTPFSAPDRRPWLDHGAWGLRAPLGARSPSMRRDPAMYDFLPALGAGLHQIPVGPVHAGIIEPGHFRFSVNGEIVARLEGGSLCHKGIDGSPAPYRTRKSSLSGDSTVAYSLPLLVRSRRRCRSIRRRAPNAARRHGGAGRIANHLGDIGAICNDASFSLIHAHCGIFRERVLAAAGSGVRPPPDDGPRRAGRGGGWAGRCSRLAGHARRKAVRRDRAAL